MKICLLALMINIITGSFAQNTGVQFTPGTWEQTLQEAKQTGKPIFLYAATPFCHFCKILKANVFPDPKVAGYYNTTFINKELNFEEEPGASLGQYYGIASYPAYLFFDKDGKLLHISGAEKTIDAFIQDGKNAFIPDSAYGAMKAAYDSGDRSPDLLYRYTEALTHTVAFDSLQLVVEKEYVTTQDRISLQSEKNLLYILKYTSNLDAPSAKYFFKYYDKLSTLLGTATVTQYTMAIVQQEAEKAGTHGDRQKLDRLKTLLKQYTGKSSLQLLAYADVKYGEGIFTADRDKWMPFADATNIYARKYLAADPQTVYETASFLHYFSENRAALQQAAKLISQLITVNSKYDYLLRQAKIYHKLKEDNKAKESLSKAMKMDARADEIEEAKDLLAEINAAKK